LEINNLSVEVNDKKIIDGFNLIINEGETHAIMGPNGAGKSTLSYAIAGKEGYKITSGQILFYGEDISNLSPDKRAAKGIFLAFQNPVEIPGVPNATFLKQAVNSIKKYNGENELDTIAFNKLLKEKAAVLGISADMLKRSVNEGFSGGEKKRLETLQMAILEPKIAILDEIDSGLDIDSLQLISKNINQIKKSMLVITHYQRLLNYIVPDFVHIFAKGKIVKSGGKDLALELEKNGYGGFVDE
jgi:Fe-S cluster assembly ATP-binding protein